MAKISTYPIISIPTFNDLLIGTDVENLNETKNFSLGDIQNLIVAGNYVPYIGANQDVFLGAFNITANSFINYNGTSLDFLKADGSLDSTVYQPAGDYITDLSGEATASGPGIATVTLDNGAVIGKVLTGLTITGGSVSSTDSILQAFGKLQNQVNGLFGGAIYQGTWDAATNSPALTSGVGTQGYYYIVNVAGSTNLDGITDWNVGDWVIFDGTSWQQVDNTDTVVSVNGQVGVVVLTTTNIAEGTNLYYLDSRVRSAVSLTTTGNSGASTYDNTTGAFNIPNYTLSGLGGVPSTRQLTINGTAYDLSADRSWSVGTVTSVGTSGPLTGGTITGIGTIGITQSGVSSDGYLSSTDWNTFNNKQNALTNPVTGTGTIYYLPMWTGVSALSDSIISYASNVVTYNYNSVSGATINYTNTSGTTYTYTIQMNNTGSPRQTYHSYTDGNVLQQINGNVVSKNLQSGQFVLPYYISTSSFAGTAVGFLGFDVLGNIITSSIPVTGLTSVGLSMPSAFTVTNSPLTSNGTIAVTGAGTASQYIRGDGQLATLPSGAGGGSAVYYYLNGSVNSTVIGYKQMDYNAVIGLGTDFNLTGNGLIAEFLTDIGNPNRLQIPGGAWNLEMFFSVSSVGGNQKFYVDLLKYDGSTFTLIASTSTNPEEITGGTSIDLYLTSIAVPETVLLITDRLAIRVYIIDNAIGRTVTLHTEDNTLCQIVTTFSGGISALNGLTLNTQYLAVGSSGSDFNIFSLLDTHTFNLPTASSTKRGALSSSDWVSFNTAYNDSIISAGVTGTTTKTLTLNQQDGGTVTASWNDYDTAPVVSVFGRIGAVLAQSGDYTTTLVTEGTNLYYLDSRARAAISLTTIGSVGSATYSSLTGVLNIPNYSTALLGYVPYTSATQSVDLGEWGISAGYFQADLTPTQIGGVGRLIWNDQDGTLDLGLKGGNVTLQVGQEQVSRVVNGTGANLLESEYKTVKIIGAQGQRLQVGLAKADNDFNSKDSLGIVTEDIGNNQQGFITTSGIVRNIDTTGALQGETWSDGDALYLSGTVFGQLTNIKPSAPIHTVIIGFVVYAHQNQGKIFVKVDNGYELEELHDVSPTPYVNNGVLYRDTTVGLWKSATIATLLGYTPANQAITLTINGTTYDLSANRTWSVGTVTSITAGSGLDGGTITGSGTISHSDTSSQPSVDNSGGLVIQDVTLDTFGHVTALASIDLDLRYVPLTRTLNGLALSSNQTFATGTTGTDFNIVSAGTVHTFNIPDASASARGFLSTGTQTIGGTKTFTNSPTVPSLYLTNMGAGSGALYYNIGESRLTLANYNVGGKVMIEVNGGNYTASFNSDLTIQLLGYTTNGILRTSSSNGTLTVDTTAYTPQSRTLSINGTTYDLTANRSWSVGTVTSVNMSVPTGLSIGGNPITSSGTLALTFTAGYSLPTNAVQAEWDDAYDNRITSLTTTGTSGAATLISNVLNIPQYQAQGNYITSLTGEATASGPGAASVTLSNSAVTGKVLTGLTVTGTTVIATDSILTAFGKLQGQVNALVGGLQYQGTWNANTNSPTITSGVGTDGYFYIVSVAGTTNIDGINDWQIGDWIVFHNTSWEKVDNTDSVTSVNGFTGAVTLTTSNISEGTNLYYLDSRARAAISLTTIGNSGASTYSNLTGILNVPQYSLAGLGGVPDTRQLTINGTAYDLSANRSWSVGTVTSIATTGPITGGTITGSGTIGITQATTSSNGYLSSTDWNTFNGKQNAITLTTTGNNGSSTLIGATLNIPSYTLTGLGGVPSTRTLTINGTSFDLSVNRTWSVGTLTSITFSGPLTGGTITGSGTVGITQSSGSANGYLSSTDWTTFNSKQNTISVTAPITLVGSTIAITQSGAAANGFLSSTDWNTFNNKQNTLSLTTTGTSGAATLVGATLNIPQYQSVITNPVTGTGTSGYLARFTGTSSIGNSVLFESSSSIGLGTASINASALFQMDSTTKGFLVPRMTSTQRTNIVTPAEGLIVYQTDSVIGLYIYSNSTWRSLTMV